MLSPIMRINVSKVTSLLERLGKYSATKSLKRNQEVAPNTSTNESLDSTEDKMVRVNFLRGKGVTRLDAKYGAFALIALTMWRKKFKNREKVKIYYNVNLDAYDFFPGDHVLCQVFLVTSLRLPISPLVVPMMNFLASPYTIHMSVICGLSCL